MIDTRTLSVEARFLVCDRCHVVALSDAWARTDADLAALIHAARQAGWDAWYDGSRAVCPACVAAWR